MKLNAKELTLTAEICHKLISQSIGDAKSPYDWDAPRQFNVPVTDFGRKRVKDEFVNEIIYQFKMRGLIACYLPEIRQFRVRVHVHEAILSPEEAEMYNTKMATIKVTQ